MLDPSGECLGINAGRRHKKGYRRRHRKATTQFKAIVAGLICF